MKWAKENSTKRTRNLRLSPVVMGAVLVVLVALLAGCESDDDCLNCVEPPVEMLPPVVPTGVHSISGDNLVIVQWYHISYPPYDDLSFNENVVKYVVYSRFLTGTAEDFDLDREFFYIGEVAWDENYDYEYTGLHWFYDFEAVNGKRYEYAVRAVNAAGEESVLSYEYVIDAPLPMGPMDGFGNFDPLKLHDGNGLQATMSGFDFAKAAAGLGNGRVDPSVSSADIVISFENGIPYVVANPSRVVLQDFGVFTDDSGQIIFEGVSAAPAEGYSRTGKIELIPGHIYVVEIQDSELHYAKFGVTTTFTDPGTDSGWVEIIWAYQTIPQLPELRAPEDVEVGPGQPNIVSF